MSRKGMLVLPALCLVFIVTLLISNQRDMARVRRECAEKATVAPKPSAAIDLPVTAGVVDHAIATGKAGQVFDGRKFVWPEKEKRSSGIMAVRHGFSGRFSIPYTHCDESGCTIDELEMSGMDGETLKGFSQKLDKQIAEEEQKYLDLHRVEGQIDRFFTRCMDWVGNDDAIDPVHEKSCEKDGVDLYLQLLILDEKYNLHLDSEFKDLDIPARIGESEAS